MTFLQKHDKERPDQPRLIQEDIVPNLIVVTITAYDAVVDKRLFLAAEMCRAAEQADYRVVVVDGSREPKAATLLRECGAQVFPELVHSMGTARRLAFFLAKEIAAITYGRQPAYFLWLEPEKHDLIRHVPRLLYSLETHDADIVVPERTKQSWDTYPFFQQETERKMNQAFALATGVQLDQAFGPVLMSRAALEYYMQADGRQWGVPDTYQHHFATMVALARGVKVASVPVDFAYPPQQKAEEEQRRAEFIQKKVWQCNELSDSYQRVGAALRK